MRCAFISLLVLSTGLFAPESPGAAITWSGATGNSNWFTASNWVGNAVPTNTDDVVLTNGATIIVLTNSAAVKSLDITNRTLQFQGWQTTLATTNDILIRNGAKLTHAANTATTNPWTPNAGVFIVCSNLTIYSGGTLNGDGWGYGGTLGNTGYGPGRGYADSAGGGYGGKGGWGYSGAGGATYGSVTNPALPGSGGGAGDGHTGAAGGGYVSIIVSGAVTVDGTISMSGSNGVGSYAGGGSGGGILIQCGSLAGGGTIRADGGDRGVGSYAGGGGGGRIAIYAANPSSFSGQLSAKYGSDLYPFADYNYKSALPGTIYLSDWSLLPGQLTNGGAGRFTAATGTAGNVTISNYSLFLEWGWETNRLKAGNVTVGNGGKITHAWNTATSTNAAGQWVPDGGIFIECSNLTVQTGGEINGNGVGYGGLLGSSGYGPGGATPSDAGGGYGGRGGDGNGAGYYGGLTYGSAANPVSPGSAGSGGGSVRGGSGGGYAQIVVSGTVTVDGIISMNGINGYAQYAGGGSGGGILIQCGSLTGGGTIRADGGNGGNGNQDGGGGGGRIAIYVTNASSFGGQMSAKHGTGWRNFPDYRRQSSVPGTIYFSNWKILPGFLTNGGAARFMATNGVAGNFMISNYTFFLDNWGWETNRLRAGDITVVTGKIMHVWNTATTTNAGGNWDPNSGIFIECSNLTVQAGGEIDGDGMGYSGLLGNTGYGPGRGYADGGGAGYGGRGGNGSGSGGATYGSSNNPVAPGSAGAGGGSLYGASGGGYAQIVASGIVAVDGSIHLNGLGGEGTYAGGGSGGGLLIRCGSLTGNGTIQANGGARGGANSGGGGGGRIAIYPRLAPFYTGGTALFTATVAGGAGGAGSTGYVGTVYIDFKPRGTVFRSW